MLLEILFIIAFGFNTALIFATIPILLIWTIEDSQPRRIEWANEPDDYDLSSEPDGEELPF